MVTDLPPGYPYQSITAPFGSHFAPYHIPAPSEANTEALPPLRSRSPPSARLHPRLLDAGVKPQKVEPSKSASFLKQEPGVEQPPLDTRPEPRGPLPVGAGRDREADREALKPPPQLLPLRVSSPPPQHGERRQDREEGTEAGQIKTEAPSYACQTSCSQPPPLASSESVTEAVEDPDRTQRPPCASDSDGQELEQSSGAACEHAQSDRPPSTPPIPLLFEPEDPMAGMLALLTASEMAMRARPSTPPAPTLLPQLDNSPLGADYGTAGSLEMVALEGMALLSQMAQSEIEHIRQEQGE